MPAGARLRREAGSGWKLELGVRALVSQTPNVARSQERARYSRVSNASIRLFKRGRLTLFSTMKSDAALAMATALRPHFERPEPAFQAQFEGLRHTLAEGVLETSQSTAQTRWRSASAEGRPSDASMTTR